MAQTMHAHIEVKCHGTWQHYANPIVKRGHGLFELVDGRDENSICRHRGLPKDASLIASACHHEMSRDGVYDEGWLESGDLPVLQAALYERNPDVIPTGTDRLDLEHGIFQTRIAGHRIAEHRTFEDSRIVFWFNG